jgi:uncharacterized protein
MKITNILFLIGFLVLLNSCSKDVIEPDRVKTFSIHSTNTGTEYPIWVILPIDYSTNIKYETIYVLDGSSFYLKPEKIAKLTENLSTKYNKQNTIIVGISSNEGRNRDFTPTVTSDGEGGSENYSKFIEFELIPKIENNFSVDTTAKSRLLIGHSYGGLVTGYFFTKHPNVFDNYLSLSPSFWYDNNIFFKYEKDSRVENATKNKLVFIGCGELEEPIVICAIEWNYRLTTFYPNCKHEFRKLKNRAHISSAFENAEAGLNFYFKNK